MKYDNLQLSTKNRVAQIVINRPTALNALNPATLKDLDLAFKALSEDDNVHVVILTGAGEKAFVAGGDISVMQPLDSQTASRVARLAQRLFADIESFPKTVIAAINGYALGGGCELALACDVRIAAETARLGQPEINLGIIPGWGGTQRLPRLVGPGKAKQMMLTGEMVTAAEALQIGLVEQVVAADQLLESAQTLAEKIASKPQIAVQLIRKAVNNGLDMPLDKAIEYEADLFGLCFATEDQKEGMAAFLEKRSAQWKNR
ncbi:enoyl-CoA hydratase-related protein [Geopsychrobacter electrodiphilus]|uniref:enoyl-CoA hydratase-related protein n=1 Tax=Geopsychrobacter electrodiphilus TaxID=225196 RepID=UPI00037CF11A|nr:enoyl-CoA hydratase-related protein [Geopsychrobacter electrodiphilus]